MKKGVTWAKWNVVDFLDGTVGLTPDLGWPYTVILMLIYRDGGATVNDPHAIGRRCGMRPTSVAKSIAKLVELGKLIVLNDGRLTNERASTEIAKVVEKSNKSRSAIKSRWEKDRAIRQQLQPHGDTNVVPANNGRNTEGIPRKELREVITTSVPSSARASSSGLEGPPTRSESSEQASSQRETERMEALRQERQARFKEAMQRQQRDPATGKRLAS